MSGVNEVLRNRARYLRHDEGQTLVEYGLIIGAVSLAIIVILAGLAPGGFSEVVTAVIDRMTA